MRNKSCFCGPCSSSPGYDCFFSPFSKIFLYSNSLSSHPLFLTHPFTCYSFVSFSPPLQQHSFSFISHHPKPHNQCFLHFPPMSHNFFYHLCGPVLPMHFHFCAKLAWLLGPSAPVTEGSILQTLAADPVACWVTGFLLSWLTLTLCSGEAELNEGFEDSLSSHACWWAEGPWKQREC